MNAPRPRILWADSTADASGFARRVLGQCYAVQVIDRSDQALALALAEQVHLIVADSTLLEPAGGIDLLRALRADDRTCHVPVVLLCTRSGLETASQSTDPQADDYLVLPCTEQELLARVRTHLQVSTLRQQLAQWQQRVLADFSERAAAEAERDRLFNSSVDPICVAGNDGYFKLLNPAWTQVLGWSTEELMSRPWADFVHPDDVNASLEAKTTIEGHQPVLNFENRYRHRDGTYRWLQWRASPQPGGERVFAVARDITASKLIAEELLLSRAKLERLIHTVEGVFWEADPTSMTFTFVSDQAERLLGYPCSRWVSESHFWLNHLHPEDRDTAVNFCLAATARMEAHQFEYRMIAADGRTVWIRDIVTVETNDGRVTCLLGILVDITAQKHAEFERLQLEAQLRQAQKMDAIGTLAGGIAHDFNNMLGVVIGNAELAQQDLATTHRSQESLAEISRAAQRARELVQRLLYYSRPHEVQRQIIPLRPVVDEALLLLRSTIPAGAEISCSLPPALPAIKADPAQIQQIIFNLVTNAWQALEGRPGRVAISATTAHIDDSISRQYADLRPGPHVCLSIADSGKGMDSRILEQIFEPFFTTRTPGGTTGLGLPIVHSIVRSHGGCIMVDSQVGSGTTFKVYFPANTDEIAAKGASSSDAAAAHGHGEHILYLDDEAAMVFLASRTLERLGYRVTGHTHAEAALAQFRRSPVDFDLVITDFNMPGMSGADVIGQLLKVRPDLAVAVISGYLRPAEIEQVYGLGVSDVIFKPNTMQEIGPVVKRLLTSRGRRA